MLEERLERHGDEREIARMLAGYGPLVDTGNAQEAAAMWEEDGFYDVDGVRLAGQDAIAEMVRSADHQAWIRGGCAHLLLPHRITVDGDAAEAAGCSLLVTREGEGFAIRRVTANRWILRRGPDGWRVASRTARLLDGRSAARVLLS